MKIGILLTNTGSPSAPIPSAVRCYLQQFLFDKRIVALSRFFWLPLLYGIILPLRSRRSAKLYQTIWTQEGAPLIVHMRRIQQQLAIKLNCPVEIGMHYGEPSIQDGIQHLKAASVETIIALPLFPQYSDTTTAATEDRIKDAQRIYQTGSILMPIKQYGTNPQYVSLLAKTVQQQWQQRNQAQHLLISFHGIPESSVAAGDPYANECAHTAQSLATYLNLKKDNWTLCYQSRFGFTKWLTPSTFDVLATLPKQGITAVDIICPGFSVDCLETLEEIVMRGQTVFLQAGGKTLRYIPALNERPEHIDLLANMLCSACKEAGIVI